MDCEQSTCFPERWGKTAFGAVPRAHFFVLGRGCTSSEFCPSRRGFLDLYPGKLAWRELWASTITHGCWQWTFVMVRDTGLWDPRLQDQLFCLIRAVGLFGVCGIGVAPESAHFSRAMSCRSEAEHALKALQSGPTFGTNQACWSPSGWA